MGASIFITTNNAAEREALASEDAPEVHWTYSSLMGVANLLGLPDFDIEDYAGTINPADVLGSWEDATSRAQSDQDIRRLRDIREVAQAASNLGRTLSWG